jgi:hypothetical protein
MCKYKWSDLKLFKPGSQVTMSARKFSCISLFKGKLSPREVVPELFLIRGSQMWKIKRLFCFHHSLSNDSIISRRHGTRVGSMLMYNTFGRAHTEREPAGSFGPCLWPRRPKIYPYLFLYIFFYFDMVHPVITWSIYPYLIYKIKSLSNYIKYK